MPAPIDVFCIAGQSNAEGRGDSALSPAVTGQSLKKVGGSLVALADPVGGANTGSAWPAFANAYQAVCGVPMCVVECATGGTALLEAAAGGSTTNWSPSGWLLGNAVTETLAALTALTAAGWSPTLRGVLWVQGESDAANYPSQSTLRVDYQAALAALRVRFSIGVGRQTRLFVFRTGRPNTADAKGYMRVRSAQDTACDAPGDLIHMVYRDCVNFPARGWMNPDPSKSELHYSQQGYNHMGSVAGGIVAAIAHGEVSAASGDAAEAVMFFGDHTPMLSAS